MGVSRPIIIRSYTYTTTPHTADQQVLFTLLQSSIVVGGTSAVFKYWIQILDTNIGYKYRILCLVFKHRNHNIF